MILKIDPEMSRVDEPTYRWFVSKLKEPSVIPFGNGVGYYAEGILVAAAVNSQFYIKK